MKAKIMGVAFAALLALGLAACSNMDSGSVNGMMLAMTAQPSTSRRVSIHVGGDIKGVDNGISATIMPGCDVSTIGGAFKYDLANLTCVLTGKSHLGGTIGESGKGEILKPDGSGNVSLDLNAAIWELTLTAYPNAGFDSASWADPELTTPDHTNEAGTAYADVDEIAGKTPALVATTSVDLRNGGQTVEFLLSATGLTGAGGEVTIKGKYKDKNVVKSYTIGLYNINDNTNYDVLGTRIPEQTFDSSSTPSVSPTTGEVPFSADFNNVAAGSYRAAVALYNSEGTQVGYWSDIVVLNPTVPSRKTDIYIDNILEPPAAPSGLVAYLVPGSYDVKNSGYYDVRLVWKDNSTNENYFRIKLDRYGVKTSDAAYEACGPSDKAVAGKVYYKDNTGALPDKQPEVDASVSSMFVLKTPTVTKNTDSDEGYPKYLSAIATTPASSGAPFDEKYTESVFYSSTFEKSSLLAGSQSVVLRLETGYIYEVKICAHNAMGDSKDAVPGTDTIGVTTGAIWTERVDATTGTSADTSESILKAQVSTAVVGATIADSKDGKYVPYAANEAGGLKGINLMSIKYLLGQNGRKYEDSNTFYAGPLYDYFRYGNDTAALSKKVASGATGNDFNSGASLVTVADLATFAGWPVIVKLANTTPTSAVSDFAYWANPTSAQIYDPTNLNAINVTVLARYGSSTSGHITIEDLQDIDKARVLVQYAGNEATAKGNTATTLKPTDSNDSGAIEDNEMVVLDASTKQYVYLAVKPAETTGADTRTYTKYKFLVGGNECYGTDNYYIFDTSNMESGTYHVVVAAYWAPQDKWFGYECSFKVKR